MKTLFIPTLFSIWNNQWNAIFFAAKWRISCKVKNSHFCKNIYWQQIYLLLSKGKTPAVSAQWWLCGIGDRGDRDLSVCHLFCSVVMCVCVRERESAFFFHIFTLTAFDRVSSAASLSKLLFVLSECYMCWHLCKGYLWFCKLIYSISISPVYVIVWAIDCFFFLPKVFFKGGNSLKILDF